MPKPIPLRPAPLRLSRHLHLRPPAPPAPEDNAARKARQLALTRELTELNMLAARDAAHRIEQRDPELPDETPAADNPTLALARATRAVTGVINLENRIAAGETAAATGPSVLDPRGVGLRKLLHPLLVKEPDPGLRRTMRLSINQRIDDALDADIDDELPLYNIASVIAAEHGLFLDIAKVPDEYLDAKPQPWHRSPDRPRYRPESDSPDQR